MPEPRAISYFANSSFPQVTGQQLSYDGERRLAHWQSSPSNPTSSADDLYDGSGNRVEQVETVGSTTTKVYYLLGGVEEVATTGSSSTLTKYYSAAGLLIGVNVGGTISYLASDGLGSVSEAFDGGGSGNVTAAQLYGPYGGVRYSSGTMPTTKGYTGQRSDAATSGLDYYNARYYDPVIGQFASADTKEGPNRYAYVADDPETLVDPSGHCGGHNLRTGCGGGGGGGGSGGGSGSCHSDASCSGGYGDGCDAQCQQDVAQDLRLIAIGGVKDWGQLIEGFAEVGASFAILIAAVWAELQGSPVPGVIFLLQRGVKWAGAVLIKIIHDGIQHIINAFGGQVNPWARVALDILNVVGDVAVLATSGFFFSKAVMERGPQYYNFFQKLGLILQRLGQGATKGVFGQAADIMGPAIINMFAGTGALVDDLWSTVTDVQVAQSST